jgi:hypothetical protein
VPLLWWNLCGPVLVECGCPCFAGMRVPLLWWNCCEGVHLVTFTCLILSCRLLHSRYAEGDKVAMNVGFYYMANAMVGYVFWKLWKRLLETSQCFWKL